MTDLILALKYLHILGAVGLIGTGIGIAFFMLMGHLTRDAASIAVITRVVVIADALFISSNMVLQPLSGTAMAWLIGYSLWESWIVVSLIFYALELMLWLPVVWIQLKLRDLARAAAASGTALPPRYHSLFLIWVALGWPAFIGILGILGLMIWKPKFW